MANEQQGDRNRDGAEPVYGPAYSARQDDPEERHRVDMPPATPRTAPGAAPSPAEAFDGPAPPYTAPYPPYPSDVPYTTPIPANVAAALAYLVAPAVVFLLLPPYRSNPLLRFHSWQAIFYFIASVAVRVVEQLLVSMLPSAVAFTVSGLLALLLLTGWIVAVIQALGGNRWQMPLIGEYAERTASTTSAGG